MSRNIIIRILWRWEMASSFIFLSVGIERWQKINVLDRALTFLVQMLNFSTISALCTTFCIRIVGRKKNDYHSVEHKPNF